MRLRAVLRRSIARLSALALLPASIAGMAALGAAPPVGASSNGCQLGNGIQHVIYLVFDNVHFTRDRPNVPSDLEQMPNLLNFLTDNGTLLTNDHTILISHTSAGILSSLTGLYPDRQGVTVGNSYGYFTPAHSVAFSSAFKYWTDKVDDSTGVRDELPNMVTDGQKNTPAPWVPFTRAGCNVGGVSTANIELENTGTGPFGDMSEVFGVGSPEWDEADASNHAGSGNAVAAKALTDFIGIAIHCAKGGGICASNATNVANSRLDKLPDEPGGYLGYQGLFGAKYVNPAINNGQACVNNTEGQPITDPYGQCGFPGFDGAYAKNSLGMVAQMQEAGVPVTYAYISDAHDNHTSSFPAPFNPNFPRASGPGEADYVAQLKAYDNAFGVFFNRLQNDGITKNNTLFVVTADEGDHFAGGVGTPQSDGTLGYAHTNCSWTTAPACPSNQIGEVNLNLRAKLGNSTFSVHSDSAPTFYVNGQPARTDPALRQLERDVFGVNAIDPYAGSSPAPVFVQMADSVGEQALHMVNTDPNRTPSFTGFANPDYFLTAANSGPSCGSNPCIDYHFAWSHGDIQPEIATTFLGLVGPGVKHLGIDSTTWTDHTNDRPTILELTGLQDDYLLDGRALTEVLTDQAVAQSLRAHRETLLRLGAAYEQVNASFGQFGMALLKASTNAINSGSSTDDSRYTSIEGSIQNLTAQRDALAAQIKTALNNAAFNGQALNEQQAKDWIAQANSLIDEANSLAAS